MKLIDKDALVAELERIVDVLERNSGYGIFCEYQMVICEKILSFLDTLEVKEVDLEEELKTLDNTLFDLDGVAVQGGTYYLTVEDVKDIAKRFFELGLKVQRESKFESCIQEGDKIVTNDDGTHFNISQLERVSKKATDTKETAKKFLKTVGIMDKNGELADEYRLEKQGEKPADKVEPKFKVNDWIVDNFGSIWKIEGIILNQFYLLEGVGGGESRHTIEWVDKTYHLWTIQDAKDGDVFVGSGMERNVILMFRGIGNAEWDDVIDYHCYYDYHRKEFMVQEGIEYWGNTENNQLKPATKEQREQLFQKMHEAGYEWDVEKKELKKIGPKFKVGDWIVWKDKNYKVNYNSCGYELFDQNGLSTSWAYKTIEDDAHLWTIQYAKDGDVLVASDGSIFIFKEVDDDVRSCKHYIALTADKVIKVNVGLKHFWETSRAVHPATKEQRDLLFQKMYEAGYEWDAKKKELKKEEVDNLHNYLYGEQNLAWSEYDENMLKSIIATCELAEQDRDSSPARHIFEMQDNWLKTLKERLKGK